jgi:hypothetical protein
MSIQHLVFRVESAQAMLTFLMFDLSIALLFYSAAKAAGRTRG